MDKLNAILSNIPDFFNKESIDSNIRNIVKAFADELELYDAEVNKYYNINDVDTAVGTELDTRWGSMLDAPRRSNETDNYYRARLKKIVSDGAGGTETAIRLGVAAVLGFGPTEAESRVQVLDSWLYDGSYDVTKANGYSVCIIDLQMQSLPEDTENLIIESIKDTKASGTTIQILFDNYRIYTYAEMATMTYDRLSMLFYNQLGDTI